MRGDSRTWASVMFGRHTAPAAMEHSAALGGLSSRTATNLEWTRLGIRSFQRCLPNGSRHDYSLRNTMLLRMPFPDATRFPLHFNDHHPLIIVVAEKAFSRDSNRCHRPARFTRSWRHVCIACFTDHALFPIQGSFALVISKSRVRCTKKDIDQTRLPFESKLGGSAIRTMNRLELESAAKDEPTATASFRSGREERLAPSSGSLRSQ